jgi:tripartite-type tricarboxylate transporter receptor subunit TctC
VAEQVKAGTIKGYVVSAAQRWPCFPTSRLRRRLGIKYDMSIWAGIFAPKGVQKQVVDKLAAALNKALDDPSVQKRLGELGGSLRSKAQRNPATFDRLVKGENRALVPYSQGRVRKHELRIAHVLTMAVWALAARCARPQGCQKSVRASAH